jgi:hypothetical protein
MTPVPISPPYRVAPNPTLMPIVSTDGQAKRPRARVWAAGFALVVALPLGMFVWSWFEPIGLDLGAYRLVFGAMYGPVSNLGPGWHRFPNGWQLTVELPGRSGIYGVSCVKPLDPR